MPLKSVIFDMDGILIDSEPLHMKAFNSLLHSYRIHFTAEYFQTLIGISSKENITMIKEVFGLKESEQYILAEKDRLYHQQIDKLLAKEGGNAANPGIISFIQDLFEEDLLLAVASSSPLEEIHRILSGLGLLSYFHTFASGEEVPQSKPAPDVFLLALKRLGVAPENTLVIEDSAPGVSAAKKAGIKCIAVPNVHTESSDFSLADIILEDTQQLNLDILNTLFPSEKAEHY